MIIDPNDVCFQLGRDLYDAHVLHDQVSKNNIDTKKILNGIEKYCKLINCVGLLRAECIRLKDEYSSLKDKINNLSRGT